MKRELAFLGLFAIFLGSAAKDPYEILQEDLAKTDSSMNLPSYSEFGRRLAFLLIQVIAANDNLEDGLTKAVTWPYEGYIAVHPIQGNYAGDWTSDEMMGVNEILRYATLQNMSVKVGGDEIKLLDKISTLPIGGLAFYNQGDVNSIVMYFYKIPNPLSEFKSTYQDLREALKIVPKPNLPLPKYDPTWNTKAAEFAAEQAMLFILNQHPISTIQDYILKKGFQISAVVMATSLTNACKEGVAALGDIISRYSLHPALVEILLQDSVKQAKHAALHILELPDNRSMYTFACHFAIPSDKTEFWSLFQD